jgi:hypothetical protein
MPRAAPDTMKMPRLGCTRFQQLRLFSEQGTRGLGRTNQEQTPSSRDRSAGAGWKLARRTGPVRSPPCET